MVSSVTRLARLLPYRISKATTSETLVLALMNRRIKMKDEKKEKKLRLGKIRIQNLDAALKRDDQQAIKAGNDNMIPGTTILPVFCI